MAKVEVILMASVPFIAGLVLGLQWSFVSSPVHRVSSSHRLRYDARLRVGHACARGSCSNNHAITSGNAINSHNIHSETHADTGNADYHRKISSLNANLATPNVDPETIRRGRAIKSRISLAGVKLSNDRARTKDALVKPNKKLHHLKAILQSKTSHTADDGHYIHAKSSITNERNVANVSTSGTRFSMRKNATTSPETRGHGVSQNFDNLSAIISDGVFWSDSVDGLVRTKFSDEYASHWRTVVADTVVANMTDGCGRMQNRRIQFADGRWSCARYRINTDQIQGDIFSYHLSRLLRIRNVPPSILLRADPTSPTWRLVSDNMSSAQWRTDRLVVLTPWLNSLRPAFIPPQFRTDSRRLHPPDLIGLNSSQLTELVQWSDLIVFDYITANVDRVVNNMFNLQWNSEMMTEPAHNLMASPTSASLVFLDNESGLFHSYRLLDRYAHYHESLLKSLCIFRRAVAEQVEQLYHNSTVSEQLDELLAQTEPLSSVLQAMPPQNRQILHRRLGNVYAQILKCKRMFKQM